DNLALRAGVKFDGQLLLFRKTLLTLEGVLADLLQTDVVRWQALLDEVLVANFLQHWTAEWPERFYAPLGARSFATHISTADVASVLWTSPLTVARWWSETSRDVLQLCRKRAGCRFNGPRPAPGAQPRHSAPAQPIRHRV
ncbi:MAG TPA: hypothetical protein VNT26_16420, partial [Candidatus Sulfotelmatobacter sp.]|nr:hypothetical protein [Candidatus Sulfotelmatobacter sp.]